VPPLAPPAPSAPAPTQRSGSGGLPLAVGGLLAGLAAALATALLILVVVTIAGDTFGDPFYLGFSLGPDGYWPYLVLDFAIFGALLGGLVAAAMALRTGRLGAAVAVGVPIGVVAGAVTGLLYDGLFVNDPDINGGTAWLTDLLHPSGATAFEWTERLGGVVSFALFGLLIGVAAGIAVQRVGASILGGLLGGSVAGLFTAQLFIANAFGDLESAFIFRTLFFVGTGLAVGTGVGLAQQISRPRIGSVAPSPPTLPPQSPLPPPP
jgi:hypothetical protein